ncbi:hypothetical protein OBBRIDRAFT_799151, partial [Obba rivulosa]
MSPRQHESQNGGNPESEHPGEPEIGRSRAIYILQQTLPDFFSTGLVSSLETPIGAVRDASTDIAAAGLPLYMASSVFVRHTLNTLYPDLRVTLRRVRVHGPRSGTNGSSLAGGPASLPGLSDQSPGPEGDARAHRSIREKGLFVELDVSGVARVSGERGVWEV